MKNILIVLAWIAITTSLIGCSAEKQFQKALNKYGQKESAAYLVTHYPEYFTTTKDSVKATTITPGVNIDTAATLERLHDTVTIIKDRVVMKQIYVNGKVYTTVKVPADTVIKWLPCPEAKTPNVDKLKVVKNGVDWDVITKISGLCIGILGGLALFILLIRKRKE